MTVEDLKVEGQDKPFKYQKFESMSELHRYIAENHWEKYKGLLEHIEEQPSFFDCRNFQQAYEELRLGKKDLTAKYMKEVKDDSKIKGEVLTQSFALAEQGTIYDIGAVIAGVPECCIEDMPLPKLRKKITIYLDMGYCGGVDAKHINNRGIALYNFVNTLVRQNYIVDIYLLTCTHYYNHDDYDGLQLVRVTNINNRPLLPHLAFGSTTSFFRAINWMVMGMPFEDYKGSKTWESAVSRTPKNLRDKFLKDKIFYIGGGYTNNRMEYVNTIEAAEKEIVRLYNGFLEGKDLNE